ncbi:DUF4230 domain-containing protein [Defluviitalea saccharophila]|uniref:DUF4230 domain-containing protein n=1 Tax=Defluviitalea saccharophila TaxID=879970 RepID=A0ABZ2Y4U2_9FIRM|nr:DUF4230 domain-containing protein [Candidatus Epulonipiscium sp.]
MKKILVLLLTAIILVISTSCKQAEPEPINMEPKVSQMKSICELAVMECYYHNVAKLKEEDAEGILWWKKDKHFWIEYSGIVKLGIDASLVTMEVNGTQIKITLPEAKVLGCKVDSTSLQEDSYIVDVKSATISAEDEVKAFAVAQQQLEENAASNRALLAEAQQRAQTLLEEYIINIGNALGQEYSIQWVYLDSQGKPLSSTINTPITENEPANTENSSN